MIVAFTFNGSSMFNLPAYPATYFKGKRFFLMPADEQAYCDLLAQAFSGFRLYEYQTYEHQGRIERGPTSPTIVASDFEAFPQESMVSVTLGALDRHALGVHPYEPKPPLAPPLGVRDMYPSGHWRRYDGSPNATRMGNAEVPAFLGEGDIYFRCRRDEPEDARMAARALRLLEKVGSRLVINCAWPEFRFIGEPYKQHAYVGHHARAWLEADPAGRRLCRWDMTDYVWALPPLEKTRAKPKG